MEKSLDNDEVSDDKRRKNEFFYNLFVEFNSLPDGEKKNFILSNFIENKIEVLKFILKNCRINNKEINVKDIKNINKQNLLMIAAFNGNIELVRFLLDKGLDINLQDIYGQTALMFAIDNSDNIKMVRFLVENGANINLKDNNDKTAIIIAIENKYKEISDYLKESGLTTYEVLARDEKGNPTEAVIDGYKRRSKKLLKKSTKIKRRSKSKSKKLFKKSTKIKRRSKSRTIKNTNRSKSKS